VKGRKVLMWQYSSAQWAPMASTSLWDMFLAFATAEASRSLSLLEDEEAMVEGDLGAYRYKRW